MLVQQRWVQGWHLNAFGVLFGGQILSWVDEDTNILAYNSSHPHTSHTTAGYERVSFLRPCKAADRIKFIYDIVHYGTRSVTVRCVATNQHGERVFACLTTMVRTDDLEGLGLLPEIVEQIDKEAWPWKLVEQLRAQKKAEEPL